MPPAHAHDRECSRDTYIPLPATCRRCDGGCMTNVTNYAVRLTDVGALEDFTAYIKDAVIAQCTMTERFSAVRLKNTRVRYNDFLHGVRGIARENETIEVTQSDSALQLAGTIVHELA